MATETKIIEIRVDLLKGLEDINKLQLEIKALTDIQKTYTKESKAMDEAYAARTVKIRELTKQLNTLVRETANEAKVTTEKLGYMQKLEAEVSNLTLAYKRLTKEELEGDKGNQVLTNLKAKRDELAKLNQAYGNYTHDVGNYAKGTNQLSIMMGQVMKEAPNFAISARIGIMSLSNNLVPLAEAIKAVKLQNAELQAQGKATQSIMSTVGKSIFGLTGILSMVVVLFQLFGEDIIKFIGKIFEGDKQIRKTTESMYGLNSAMKTMNSTMKDGGGVYLDAVKSIKEMSVQLQAAKGNHIEETIALDKYNKGLGENFGKATSVSQALDLIASKKDAYVDAMMKMSFANAFLAKSSQDIVNQVDVMTKSQGDLVREAGYDYEKMYKDVETIDARIRKLKESGASAEANMTVQTNAGVVVMTGNTLKQLEEMRYRAAIKLTSIEMNEREKQLSDLKKHQGVMSQQYQKYYNEYLNELERAGIKSASIDEDGRKKKKETFDYEQKLRDALAQAVNDNMNRELEKARADIKTKQDDLDNAYAKKLVTQAQYNELSKAYTEQLSREENTIIEKYIDKNLKAYENYINSQKKLLDGMIDDFWNYVKNSDDAILNLYKGIADSKQNELDLIKLKGIEDVKIQKDALEARRQLEIENAKKTGEDVTSINRRYAQLKLNVERDALYSKFEMASDVTSGHVDLLGKETEAGKFAAAANVGIKGAESAFKTGVLVSEYIAAANFPMAILAGLETGVIVANTAASIAKIYAVDTNVDNKVSKPTVTSKYHNSGIAGSDPLNQNQDNEVTATLLKGERVLSLQQTAVFDSILRNVASLGGSTTITNNVGTVTDNNYEVMAMYLAKEIAKIPPPQLSLTEWARKSQRELELKNNLIVK